MVLVKFIASLYVGICLLRTGPEQLPRTGLFAGVVIAVDLLVQTLAIRVLQPEAGLLVGLASSVVIVATVTGITWGMLALRGHAARLQQATAAIFGCDALLTSLQLGLLPIVGLLPEVVATVFFMAGFGWAVAINGFVLHRALGVNLASGIMLALGTMIFAMLMALSLNPIPASSP